MWLRRDPGDWNPLVIACTFYLLLYHILYFKQKLCEYTLSIYAIFNDEILCNQCKRGKKRPQNSERLFQSFTFDIVICV